MSRRTYLTLHRQATRWLRRGRSIVLDATYGKPADRLAVRQIARRAGARLLFVACNADEATLRARLAARLRDPNRVSDAHPGLWPAMRAAYIPPTELTDVVTVDTTQTLDQVVQQILAGVRGSTGATRRAA